MLALFPEGFEEVEHDGDLELAAYAGAGAEERFWQTFGPGTVADVEEGWEEAWRRFHRPVRVGPLWVGPPWEDPDAVDATVANAGANGVELDVRLADAFVDPLPEAMLALANVTRESVERVAPRLASSELITSGYLAGEQPSLAGWTHRHRREREGWAADLFARVGK